MMGRRGLLVLVVAGLLCGGALSWSSVGESSMKAREPEQSPREVAEEIARFSRTVLQPFRDQEPREVNRDGIYLLLSLSMPDEVLKGYFAEAKLLGARIVIRGLLDAPSSDGGPVKLSFTATGERFRQLMGTDEALLASVSIDPVLYGRLGVSEVPALAVVKGDHDAVMIGSTSVRHLLEVLAREERPYRALAEWFDRRQGGFLQGGPTTEPRPSLPMPSGHQRIRTDAPTWSIAERDMKQVLSEAVARADWKAIKRRAEDATARKLHRGPHLPLPDAQQPRSFLVDATVQFPDDVTDPKTGTLYIKAGSTLNPLDKVKLPYTLIFFNGNSQEQVQWVQHYLLAHEDRPLKLLVTEGDIGPLGRLLHRPVYWANQLMYERFGLVAVPSLVTQEGNRFRVQEIVP
jgi:type-F conjugative transfer system pilin assembly protein TrbC